MLVDKNVSKFSQLPTHKPLNCIQQDFWKYFAPKFEFLERYILFGYQFVYRKLLSTTIGLIEINDNRKRLLNEGNCIKVIYLDLTKAFDTVNHRITLKLFKKIWRYGIRGHANDVFDPIWPTDNSTRVQMEKTDNHNS